MSYTNGINGKSKVKHFSYVVEDDSKPPKLDNENRSFSDGSFSNLQNVVNKRFSDNESRNRSSTQSTKVSFVHNQTNNPPLVPTDSSKGTEFETLRAQLLKTARSIKNTSMPAKTIRHKSAGIMITDIEELLFDPKEKPTNDHKMITDFVKNTLLYLNKNIPVRHKFNPDKLTNSRNLIKWVDSVTDSPILNLFLFRQTLSKFVELLENSNDEIKSTNKVPDIAKENVAIITEKFKITEKIAKQFKDLNECFSLCSLELNEDTNSQNNKQNEFELYSVRMPQIIPLYKTYITSLESRIYAFFLAETKFEIYCTDEREKKAKVDLNLISDKRAVAELAKKDQVGKSGERLLTYTKAGECVDWVRILKSKEGLVFSNKKSNLIFDGVNKMENVENYFCNVLDFLYFNLQLEKDPSINVLKKYFIKAEGLEKDFALSLFLDQLGFSNHFGLTTQQLDKLQEVYTRIDKNAMKAEITALKKNILSIIAENQKGFLEKFIDLFCIALHPIQTSKDAITDVCYRFENICKLLYLIEADINNVKRNELSKLLTVFKLVNQENALRYIAKGLNYCHKRITGIQMFHNLANISMPIQKFEIEISQERLNFKTTALYDCEKAITKEKSCLGRETTTYSVSSEDLLKPEEWTESTVIKIILKEAPNVKLQEHLDLFQISLFHNEIPYKIVKPYEEKK